MGWLLRSVGADLPASVGICSKAPEAQKLFFAEF